MHTVVVGVKRCFASRLEKQGNVRVIRPWNELFRFMALRTRHIWFILHLFEIRFITRPVIPMDMDGLRWIPMDPIGFRRIGIGGYHPTTFLPGPLWFSSDFRYSFASNVSYFRWKVLRIESCLFHRKTTFPLVCIGKVWQKVNIYLFLMFKSKKNKTENYINIMG